MAALKCRFEHIQIPMEQDGEVQCNAESISALRRVKATVDAGGSVGLHRWEESVQKSIFVAAALCSIWDVKPEDAASGIFWHSDRCAAYALSAHAVREFGGITPSRLKLQACTDWSNSDVWGSHLKGCTSALGDRKRGSRFALGRSLCFLVTLPWRP